MGRVDTSRHSPPVRIARASARVQASQMVPPDFERLAHAAGNFGAREVRNASVPIRLRIQKDAGPNTDTARQAAIAMGVTRRKRGFPPIVTLPTPGR